MANESESVVEARLASTTRLKVARVDRAGQKGYWFPFEYIQAKGVTCSSLDTSTRCSLNDIGGVIVQDSLRVKQEPKGRMERQLSVNRRNRLSGPHHFDVGMDHWEYVRKPCWAGEAKLAQGELMWIIGGGGIVVV